MAGRRFSLDSSCLIPLLFTWDERHGRTAAVYRFHVQAGDTVVLAAHAVLECCSVVTRIPVSHRITIQEAVRRIQENFSSVELAACTASRYWDLLDEMAARDVFGGRLYDSLIARTVVDAGVTLLLTWNARHFRQVAPPGLEIREP